MEVWEGRSRPSALLYLTAVRPQDAARDPACGRGPRGPWALTCEIGTAGDCGITEIS
jgi:hypothetical protein